MEQEQINPTGHSDADLETVAKAIAKSLIETNTTWEAWVGVAETVLDALKAKGRILTYEEI